MAGCGGMFICSKLTQNLSEMELKTFVIQRVIWDHLLAFKGEISQKQALFSFPCQSYTVNNCRVVMLSVLAFENSFF